MHFEVVSDRDVVVDGIGLLEANKPKEITDSAAHLFEVLQNASIVKANFPNFVKVTVVVDPTE